MLKYVINGVWQYGRVYITRFLKAHLEIRPSNLTWSHALA